MKRYSELKAELHEGWQRSAFPGIGGGRGQHDGWRVRVGGNWYFMVKQGSTYHIFRGDKEGRGVPKTHSRPIGQAKSPADALRMLKKPPGKQRAWTAGGPDDPDIRSSSRYEAVEPVVETDSRMYGDDEVVRPMMRGGKPKPKPCKGKGCPEEKKPRPFMGYEETQARRDGDVWQTDGGWAAQARGITDYFDSEEKARAYAQAYSSQRRGAFTKTRKQSPEFRKAASAPRKGGRMLGGDLM